jgi:hypothetical protein
VTAVPFSVSDSLVLARRSAKRIVRQPDLLSVGRDVAADAIGVG